MYSSFLKRHYYLAKLLHYACYPALTGHAHSISAQRAVPVASMVVWLLLYYKLTYLCTQPYMSMMLTIMLQYMVITGVMGPVSENVSMKHWRDKYC